MRLSTAELGLFASFAALVLLLFLAVPWYLVALPLVPFLVCALALFGRHCGPALLIWAMSKLAERSIQ